MTTYQYLCLEHGTFEIRATMGTAPRQAVCPTCDAGSRRLFTAPTLRRVAPAVGAAVDRAERSREAPEVVAAPPPRRRPSRPTAPANPALRRLPRP